LQGNAFSQKKSIGKIRMVSTLSSTMCLNIGIRIPVGKITKRAVWFSEGVRFLLIQHSKYSSMLWKIHLYRLLF